MSETRSDAGARGGPSGLFAPLSGRRAVVLGAVALAASMAAGVAWGTEPISLWRAARDPASLDRTIALGVRLPRVLLGAIAGGGLAVVGASFQAILRNPLAEPYVLGVSGGAALGATLAILAGLGMVTVWGASLVPLAALAGGLVATFVVNGLARYGEGGGGTSGASVLLAGVVVNAIASAAITFLKTLVSATRAQELLFWLIGFLDVPSAAGLLWTALYVGVGSLVLLRDAGSLNLLALGDEPAAHLGVDVRALERRTFVVCSLVVGAIVSMTGLIGFVGLIVPHAVRRIAGPDVRIGLPASLLGGGAALVLCDLASRVLFRVLHTEPPVGAVTALLGGPLFLVVMRKRSG